MGVELGGEELFEGVDGERELDADFDEYRFCTLDLKKMLAGRLGAGEYELSVDLHLGCWMRMVLNCLAGTISLSSVLSFWGLAWGR